MHNGHVDWPVPLPPLPNPLRRLFEKLKSSGPVAPGKTPVRVGKKTRVEFLWESGWDSPPEVGLDDIVPPRVLDWGVRRWDYGDEEDLAAALLKAIDMRKEDWTYEDVRRMVRILRRVALDDPDRLAIELDQFHGL